MVDLKLYRCKNTFLSYFPKINRIIEPTKSYIFRRWNLEVVLLHFTILSFLMILLL